MFPQPPIIYPFLFCFFFLLLCQTPLSIHAAAIEPSASLLSLPLPASLSFFDEADLTALAHLHLFLNNTSLSDTPDLFRYRVPGTHTTLGIAIHPDHPIPKQILGRTILRTQQALAAFIKAHDARDELLSPANDPYESPPSTSPGCHIGVASLPASTYGYQHLTYGIVSDVLQGLWLYLYRGERFTTAIFEVADDQFGSVGVGKVSEQRPFVEGGG